MLSDIAFQSALRGATFLTVVAILCFNAHAPALPCAVEFSVQDLLSGMSSSSRGNWLHDNLSATRNLLSEVVRQLDAASVPTETAAYSAPGRQLTPQESPNVEAHRDMGAGLGCSRWFDRRISVSYLYRPFSARGLSLKRANMQGSSRPQLKKKKVSMWEKEFICLAHVDQKRAPAPLHKAELIRAGLGVAQLNCHEILDKFPKLCDGGGYELLRTVGSSHELQHIPPPSGGYTAAYVKNVVNKAKVYVRPLKKDLSLDEVVTQSELVSEATFMNVYCYGRVITGLCSWSDVR